LNLSKPFNAGEGEVRNPHSEARIPKPLTRNATCKLQSVTRDPNTYAQND